MSGKSFALWTRRRCKSNVHDRAARRCWSARSAFGVRQSVTYALGQRGEFRSRAGRRRASGNRAYVPYRAVVRRDASSPSRLCGLPSGFAGCLRASHGRPSSEGRRARWARVRAHQLAVKVPRLRDAAARSRPSRVRLPACDRSAGWDLPQGRDAAPFRPARSPST